MLGMRPEDELGPEDARRAGRGNLFGAGPPGQVGLTEDDLEKLDGLGWKKLVRRSELHHRKVCVVELLLYLASGSVAVVVANHEGGTGLGFPL